MVWVRDLFLLGRKKTLSGKRSHSDCWKKFTISNRKYIDWIWVHFPASYVSLPECRTFCSEKGSQKSQCFPLCCLFQSLDSCIIQKMAVPLGWYPTCCTPTTTHFIRCIWRCLFRVTPIARGPSEHFPYKGRVPTEKVPTGPLTFPDRIPVGVWYPLPTHWPHKNQPFMYPYHPCMAYLPTFGWFLW